VEKERIRSVIEKAVDDGIDHRLLVPRVQEAAAKRVPAEELVRALEEEIGRLKDARRIWRDLRQADPGPAEWQRTANLLSWGATRQELEGILRSTARREADYVAATDLFVGLVRWGLPRGVALKLSVAVSDSRLDRDDFAIVTETLSRGRGVRLTPVAIAERMLQVLPEVESGKELQERILYE
jgi:hypothetical protein